MPTDASQQLAKRALDRPESAREGFSQDWHEADSYPTLEWVGQ